MITFKPIVIPNNRRKDGTYNIKIRVTFKCVSRRLPTTLYCTANDLTRTLKIKNGDLLAKGNELCDQMRNACRDISPIDLESADVDWVVAHIKKVMSSDNFRLDFFEWSDKYLQSKTKQTRANYDAALNALARFLGKRELDINDISRTMLLEFIESYESENKYHWDVKQSKLVESNTPRGAGASSRHLMKLQNIFNAAKDRYNDEDSGRIVIPKSPFAKIERHYAPPQGQKNLGVELMQKILDAQTDNPVIRIALDAFVVSFGLMGANMADLYNAVPFTGDWVYNRQKTATRRADQAEMRVKIPDQIEPYIQRLQDCRGAWWLPALHHMSEKKDLCTARVNRALKLWCESNGVQVFTFYAARHTWATLARKAGVEKATIDECLCHIGDYQMTDIYAERDWDIINQANEKVLNLLHFSQ